MNKPPMRGLYLLKGERTMTPEELGYGYNNLIECYVLYKFGYGIRLVVWKYESAERYNGYVETLDTRFNYQDEIDNLQIAYNQLQQDLKELNK